MATKSSTKNKSALAGTSVADVLTVKHDQVTVTAAGGNDTIKITKGNSSNVSGGTGADTITVSLGKSHVIHGNAASDTITIGKSVGTGIKVYGDAGNDTIKATNSYSVTFYGGDGSDTLTGGKSADKLYGQAGSDKLYGGAGNDYLYGGDAADKLYGQDGADKLYGQNGNDYLYGGNGNDTLSSGAGDDWLYGQAGTDTLTGGAGKDTFVYANGGGSDNITDYAAGYDTLQISNGSVSKTALANSSKDLVFTVGTGKVTLTNAASKAISLKDSRGSYTASKTAITLGSNFTGTMDTAKYLGTVTTVNGKSTTKAVTIKGNANANTINGGSAANTIYGYAGNDKLYGYGGNDTLYGGDDDDTLYGGAGTDTLTGGAGQDTFVYANGEGSDTIKDYAAGQDTLYISSGSIAKTSLANGDKDLVFAVGSGKVTLTNAASKAISLKDSRGKYIVSNTTITLASDFTGTMDATKYLASVKTIDGRNATNTVNIIGNSNNCIIYAGKSGGTIQGGNGDDELYSYDYSYDNIHAKETVFIGGEGKDIFHCPYGVSTINDYTEEDFIETSRIFNTKVENDNVLLTVGFLNYYDGVDEAEPIIEEEIAGTITLRNAAEKVIHLADYFDGHLCKDYLAVSKESIILGKDCYYPDIDANAYFPTITTIDARNAVSADWLKITGNNQNNIIYAKGSDYTLYGGSGNDTLYGYNSDESYGNRNLFGGDGDDTLYGGGSDYENLYGDNGNDTLYGGGGDWNKLYGGDGDDTLYGGGVGDEELYGNDGNDTFMFTSTFTGGTTIMDYRVGEDIIAFKDDVSISYGYADGDDVNLSLSTDGHIYIAGAAGKEITFDFNNDGNKSYQTFT